MDTKKQSKLVKPLPGELRSKIRSGIAITSIADCVEELVYNSVDAGAKTITVRVNLDNFNVTVADDGCGLTERDLESVGIRYSTSKCSSMADLTNLQYYGYRGEALASIIEVSSTVDISTRPRETLGVELFKKYDNGRVAGFIEKHNTPIRQSGTTVVVGKLLSKLPVRQKRVDRSIQLEEVKTSLEKIVLINPSLNMELRNDKSGLSILKVVPSTSYAEAFNQLYKSTIGYDINFIEEHFLCKKLFFALSISNVHYKKKYYQFVFLNGRFLRRSRIHKWLRDSLFDKATNGSSPKSDKYPVYILNITCPLGEYDVALEPKKQVVEFTDWESVQSGIDGLISKLKSKHNIGIVEKSTAKRVDKNQSNVTSYDVKGALHSRFVARSHEHESEVKGCDSDRGSIGRSGSSTDGKRETRIQRSLTRTGSNSHVVDVRALRKKRTTTNKINAPAYNTSLSIEPSLIKKPRLTAGVFEKFPEWTGEFQKEKAPLPIQRSKSSSNFRSLHESTANLVDVNDREVMEIDREHYVGYDQWKMQRFFRDHPMQNEHLSNKVDDKTFQKEHILSQASSSTANDGFKTPASTDNNVTVSITEVEDTIRSKSEQYLETLFKNKWSNPEANNKRNIVKAILQVYSRTMGHESRDVKSCSSLFKSRKTSKVQPQKAEPQFKKPRPKSTCNNQTHVYSAKHNSNNTLDTSMQSNVSVRADLKINPGGETATIRECAPPLLNAFPLQKSHTAEWNDNMMLSDYCESDSDLFPTDWTVEVVSDANNQEWLKTTDANGKMMFVNLNSGQSSYDMVRVICSSRKVSAEEMKRCNPKKFMWLRKYFPRGFHQFCNSKPREVVKEGDPTKLSTSILGKSVQHHIKLTSDIDDSSKWKWRDYALSDDSKYFNKLSAYHSGVQTFTSLTSSELRCWKKLDGVTNSFRFSKDDLNNINVICPFDRKFILATLKQSSNEKVMIVAFDQHAVHERIRLEKFVEESFVNPKGVKKYLKSMGIMPPYKFNMSETEVRLLQTFEDFFNQNGLKFQPISSTCIKIKGVPKCFGERAATEPLASREQLFRGLIFNLIQEQIHHIRETKKGSFTTMPKAVFEVLCSQACHGAIKFGDELDMDTCKQLISDLKQCKTPFQCAHGRPSVVPLTYVDNFSKTHPLSHSSAPDAGCSKCPNHNECSSYFCKGTSDTTSGYFSFFDATSISSKEPQERHTSPFDPFGFGFDVLTEGEPSDFDNLFMPVSNSAKNERDDEESPYFF